MMDDDDEQEMYDAAGEVLQAAATITSALISRLDIPSDRDDAADYAVALFWRVMNGMVANTPGGGLPNDFDL